MAAVPYSSIKVAKYYDGVMMWFAFYWVWKIIVELFFTISSSNLCWRVSCNYDCHGVSCKISFDNFIIELFKCLVRQWMLSSFKNTDTPDVLFCCCCKDECKLAAIACINVKVCYHSMFFYNNCIGGKSGSSCVNWFNLPVFCRVWTLCYQGQFFECDIALPFSLIHCAADVFWFNQPHSQLQSWTCDLRRTEYSLVLSLKIV